MVLDTVDIADLTVISQTGLDSPFFSCYYVFDVTFLLSQKQDAMPDTPPTPNSISVDNIGVVRVGQVKAPFRFDPRTGTITFVPKDRRHRRPGQRVVEVRLVDLAGAGQPNVDSKF